MLFKVSDFKVNEVAKIFDLKAPTISKKFKDLESPQIKKKNNRIIGISSNEIEKYFRDKGHSYLYKTSIHLFNSTVGGTGKTSASISILSALRRITAINNLEKPEEKKACIFIDMDSQSSLTGTVLGKPVADNQPVLVDYFEKRANLEDILQKANDSQEIYCIGSNLNNIYLDKVLSTPNSMKNSMKNLLDDLLNRFGEGSRIVIDSPPQLSFSMNSTICALSQYLAEGKDYNIGLVIPIRPDDYALKGARISYNESQQITSTFNLPEIPTYCFLSAFDKRLKIGIKIMRDLLQDDLLGKYVSPIMVRHSSEVSKANMNKESIFSGRTTSATSDYQDLALYLLGYKDLV